MSDLDDRYSMREEAEAMRQLQELRRQHTTECLFGHWMATNYRAVQHYDRHILRFAFYGGRGEPLPETPNYVCPACIEATTSQPDT